MVLDEGMDEVNVRCERVDVWRDCDEVRMLDEGILTYLLLGEVNSF